LKAQQAKVFSAVEANQKLLDLLKIATSPAGKTLFIDSLLEILPTTFDQTDKQPDDLFALFPTWFGNYANSNVLFTGISASLRHRQHYFLENRFKKRQFISDIGLDWTADAKSLFYSKVYSACDIIWKSSFLS
jgi:hypothetical protein